MKQLCMKMLFLSIVSLALGMAAVFFFHIQTSRLPRRLTMPWDYFPACPVSPSSQDIPDEGRLTLKEILGEKEAVHVESAVCSPYVRLQCPMRYKRSETATTIYVQEISNDSYTIEQFQSGEVAAIETKTFVALTIDNRTGKILIPEGTPSISRRELDSICRPLLKDTFATNWEIWIDSVHRVSDWYVVRYRRQKQPFREGDKPYYLVFWINAWTRRAVNDKFTIEYADS